MPFFLKRFVFILIHIKFTQYQRELKSMKLSCTFKALFIKMININHTYYKSAFFIKKEYYYYKYLFTYTKVVYNLTTNYLPNIGYKIN